MSENREFSHELETTQESEVQQIISLNRLEELAQGYEPVPLDDERVSADDQQRTHVGELRKFAQGTGYQLAEILTEVHKLPLSEELVSREFKGLSTSFKVANQGAREAHQARLDALNAETKQADKQLGAIQASVDHIIIETFDQLRRGETLQEQMGTYEKQLPAVGEVLRHALGAQDYLTAQHEQASQERDKVRVVKATLEQRLRDLRAWLDSPEAAETPQRKRSEHLRDARRTELQRSVRSDSYVSETNRQEYFGLLDLTKLPPAYTDDENAALKLAEESVDEAGRRWEEICAREEDLSARKWTVINTVTNPLRTKLGELQAFYVQAHADLGQEIAPKYQQSLADVEVALDLFSAFEEQYKDLNRLPVAFDDYDARVAERDDALEEARTDRGIRQGMGAVIESFEDDLNKAAELADEVIEGRERIRNLTATVAERDDAITGLESVVAERDRTIEGGVAELEQEKTNHAETEAYAKQLELDVDALERAVRERDGHIEALLNSNGELSGTLGEKTELAEELATRLGNEEAKNGVLSDELIQSRATNERLSASNLELERKYGETVGENNTNKAKLGSATRRILELETALGRAVRLADAKQAFDDILREGDAEKQPTQEQAEQSPARPAEPRPQFKVVRLNEDAAPVQRSARAMPLFSEQSYTTPHEEDNGTHN